MRDETATDRRPLATAIGLVALALSACKHDQRAAPAESAPVIAAAHVDARAPEASAPATPEAEGCRSPTVFRIHVEGTYAFTERAWPRVDVTPDPEGGHVPQAAWDVLRRAGSLPVWLPRYPGVVAVPRDLCSVDRRGTSTTLTCLAHDATLARTTIDDPAGCLDLLDDVGSRDLEPLRQRWSTALSRCAETAPTRRLPVVLEVVGAPDEDTCWHPQCRVLRAHLRVPSLGVNRDLGILHGIQGTCFAQRMPKPEGIKYICDDESGFSARVYEVGHTLVFPVDHDWLTVDHPDASGDDGLHSLDLPCDAKVELQVRGDVPIKWLEPNPDETP